MCIGGRLGVEWGSGWVVEWLTGRVARWPGGRVADWSSGQVAEWLSHSPKRPSGPAAEWFIG
ncbi:hypothetical protein DF268_29870 [Streptomyces sp. V2]|nr:hypothetical protein DF268_29870 [Streptomyces sp. V2]